jgi:hypothetical protein
VGQCMLPSTSHLSFFRPTLASYNFLLRMATKNTYMDLNKFVCGIGMLTYMHQTVMRLTSRHSRRYITCKLMKSITSFRGRVLLNTHVGTFAVKVWIPCFMACMIHPCSLINYNSPSLSCHQ